VDWFTVVKHFAEVAEKRSFSAVAREHFTSPSAITKQMNWLEEQVNQILLQRSTRHVGLTVAGERFYRYAQHFLRETEIVKNQLQNEEQTMRGRLAITAPKFFGEEKIAPLVVKFAKHHPCLSIEFSTTNRFVELAEEACDVAIRAAIQKDERYYNALLATVPRGVFASPEYLQKNGVPQHPKELIRFNCITNPDLQAPLIWTFKDDRYYPLKSQLNFNSVAAQLAAALAGIGLMYTGRHRVAQYVRSGQLIPILENYVPKPVQIVAVYRKMPIVATKITRFVEFLEKHLRTVNEE